MNFFIFAQFLFSTAFAFQIQCSFEMYAMTNLPSTYACLSRGLSNITQSESMTAVYGNHMNGKSNDDVGLFFIYNDTTLTFFPKDMEYFFPNLIGLYFNGCNIFTVNGDELNHFGNLSWFSLTFQPNLERIPGNLFAKTPLIYTIYMYSNRIKHVGENLLDSLEHLRYAHFGNNFCVQKVATTRADIPSLIEHLRTNCTDTTEEITSTPSEPTCGDVNEIVCRVEQNLMKLNSELIEISEQLTKDNEEMGLIFDKIYLENVETNEKLGELFLENSKIKNMLDQVLEGILELSTRPCGYLPVF
jgi:hypothetical protein